MLTNPTEPPNQDRGSEVQIRTGSPSGQPVVWLAKKVHKARVRRRCRPPLPPRPQHAATSRHKQGGALQMPLGASRDLTVRVAVS